MPDNFCMHKPGQNPASALNDVLVAEYLLYEERKLTIYVLARIGYAQHLVVKLVYQSQAKFITFQSGVNPWVYLKILSIYGAFTLKS